MLFGLAFYILLYFILKVELHFVHIWGIEFVLNIAVMHLVSLYYRRKNPFTIQDVGILDMKQWKYAKGLSILLVAITVLIYVLLANVG